MSITSSSRTKKNFDVFSLNSGKLIIDYYILNKLLANKKSSSEKFITKRLKLLLNKYSKIAKEKIISAKEINRMATFCIKCSDLIEDKKIVEPTAIEMSVLFDWYLDIIRSSQKSIVAITTICPDYPFEWKKNKAVFTDGVVGNNIGLTGDGAAKNGTYLHDLLKIFKIPITWIIGYAGFETNPRNLERMKISHKEFINKLETSALKLQRKLGIEVGVFPKYLDLTIKQFDEIKSHFPKKSFAVERTNIKALADAVDARDWAAMFFIANKLNAIIIDVASVYMGRKAYKKTEHILQSQNYTPRFFCISNYLGFNG